MSAPDPFDQGFEEAREFLIAALERDAARGLRHGAGEFIAGVFCGVVDSYWRTRQDGVSAEQMAACLGALIGDVLADAAGEQPSTVGALVRAFHATVAAWAPQASDGTSVSHGEDVLDAIGGYAGHMIAAAPEGMRAALLDDVRAIAASTAAAVAGRPGPITGFVVANGNRAQ